MIDVGYLTEWLRQLITVLLLAGFIEMLIPDNNLKKPVKLVIGLIVMVIMIQPLITIFKVRFDPERILSPSQAVSHQSSRQVLERGLKIRNRWQGHINTEQRKMAVAKINGVLGLIDEIEIKAIRFSETASETPGVLIIVVPALGRKFSDLVIDKLTRKIKNSVRLVCELSNEQIEVIWDESN